MIALVQWWPNCDLRGKIGITLFGLAWLFPLRAAAERRGLKLGFIRTNGGDEATEVFGPVQEMQVAA
jgi:hypothetical protein